MIKTLATRKRLTVALLCANYSFAENATTMRQGTITSTTLGIEQGIDIALFSSRNRYSGKRLPRRSTQ